MTTTANRSEGLPYYLDILRKHKGIAIAATIIVPLAAFLLSDVDNVRCRAWRKLPLAQAHFSRLDLA